MNALLKFVGNEQAPTSSQQKTLVGDPLVPAAPMNPARFDEHQDDLDSLIQGLLSTAPDFQNNLSQSNRDLAPLAKTADGKATMTYLRLQAGMTQQQLAEKINKKQSNVSLIESGQRSNLERNTMKLLCLALNCDMNTLNDALDNTECALARHLAEQESAASISKTQGSKTCA